MTQRFNRLTTPLVRDGGHVARSNVERSLGPCCLGLPAYGRAQRPADLRVVLVLQDDERVELPDQKVRAAVIGCNNVD